MTQQRSMFTESIEDHLALKKQNAPLEEAMPLARYDVGDPLDRFPGGTKPVTDSAPDAAAPADAPAGPVVTPDGTPSPQQAMEAAAALDEGFMGKPFEPLAGMAPMLSLVEDIDDSAPATTDQSTQMMSTADVEQAEEEAARVLRFPGGVGPREDAAPAADGDVRHEADADVDASADADADADEDTGEQPVIVVDTDEPYSSHDIDTEMFSAPAPQDRPKRPRFFGLGRRKKQETKSEDWLTQGPRDFNWD